MERKAMDGKRLDIEVFQREIKQHQDHLKQQAKRFQQTNERIEAYL